MKPFLLLATRSVDGPADAEYEAFARFGGLCDQQLVRHRLERTPLGDIDLDDWSGIILGGSPFTISDPQDDKSELQVRVERELHGLLDRIVERDFPFLGACYGIGLIGTHQGAVVDRQHAEPVGPTTIQLTDAGRDDPLFQVLPDSFEAFVGHKEAVSKLPAGVDSLASSADCPIQAFRIGENVHAIQFHPELDIRGICTRIDAYKHHGYFAPDEADALKATARGSDVRHPAHLIRRFVELHER